MSFMRICLPGKETEQPFSPPPFPPCLHIDLSPSPSEGAGDFSLLPILLLPTRERKEGGKVRGKAVSLYGGYRIEKKNPSGKPGKKAPLCGNLA